MRILACSAARHARFDCAAWSGRGISATWDDVRREGYVHDVYRASFQGDFDLAASALVAYRIFPAHRMVVHVCTTDGRIDVGTTIIQRILIGPIGVETGVRVIALERSADRAFLAYAALAGHAERGIAAFTVTRGASELNLEFEAWSRPGHWLATLGRPVARRLQRGLAREAVRSFCAAAGSAG